MKAQYNYCVKMPGVGLLTSTMGSNEKESIERFQKFEPRVTWLQALGAGYKCVKVVVVELR